MSESETERRRVIQFPVKDSDFDRAMLECAVITGINWHEIRRRFVRYHAPTGLSWQECYAYARIQLLRGETPDWLYSKDSQY